MPLSRPRVLYPLRSVHLGIYLLLQSLLYARIAYRGHFAAAVPTACMHGLSWSLPMVPTLWWTHQGDYRPQAQAD